MDKTIKCDICNGTDYSELNKCHICQRFYCEICEGIHDTFHICELCSESIADED